MHYDTHTYLTCIICMLNMFNIMNPARGFITGITRKFCKPLIELTKCNFTSSPCWPSNILKILPAYPQMIYSYVKNTRSLRLMFAMIFSNFWKLRHARESPSSYYYYSCLERLQPCRSGICPNFQLTHL